MAARLAVALAGGFYVMACLLPGEPSDAERVVFKFNFREPVRLPIGVPIYPQVQVMIGGKVLPDAQYRLEPTGPLAVDSSGFGLQGLTRGPATVRVVYQTATGTADTSFLAQVVASQVTIEPERHDITRIADTIRLTARAFDFNGGPVSNTAFRWSSRDSNVVQVPTFPAASVLATAVDDGAAMITAEVDSVFGYAFVRVSQVAARVSVAPKTDTLRSVKSATDFIARAYDSLGIVIRTAKPTWFSIHPEVATVDLKTGRATAVHGGTTKIIARVGQAADTATLVVAQVVRVLFVSPNLSTLTAIADTGRLKAEASDSAGAEIPNPQVTWSSSDSSIASVDSTGLVIAKRNGEVVITASSGRQSAFGTIVVRQKATTLQLSLDSVALNGEGSTARLEIEAFDRNGYRVANVDPSELAWRSRLALVATVDSTGRVTARGDGRTQVTVALADQTGSPPPQLSVQGATARADTAVVTVTGAPRELIAFQSDQGIEAMRSDGSLRTVLWENRATCYYDYYYGQVCEGLIAGTPAWSRDGARLAFTLWHNSSGEIYAGRADGADSTNLTNHTASDEAPQWSPDGTRIAFKSSRAPRGLYLMNADGSQVTLLVALEEQAGVSVTWSPDGSRLAYGHACDIHVINADRTGARNVGVTTSCEHWPAWSPDGSQLAFVSDGGQSYLYALWLSNADGSGTPTRLTSELGSGGVQVLGVPPAWSPDGSTIVFAGCSEPDSYYYSCNSADLYAVNRDGSGLRRLTNTENLSETHASWRRAAPLPALPASPPSIAPQPGAGHAGAPTRSRDH